MNVHASPTRPVRLTRAALKDTHASLARSVPDPCSLFLAASAALLTHEPLFSTRDQMLLLNKSFTTLSTPDLPFKAWFEHSLPLLSSHRSTSASPCSDPQFPTLHRSPRQRLRLMEINGDFNLIKAERRQEMPELLMMVMEAKIRVSV